MNIRDLTYLVAVADTEHFGQAAEQSFVSQPTLSTQLKKLEGELGVQIFERNNKRVHLTETGKLIVDQARRVLHEVAQLKELAQESRDPLAGTFRLGIIPTLGPYLLPHILNQIKKQLPNLKLVVCENKTETITKQLRKGSLDAIILALPIASEGLVENDLFAEPFYVALPKDHKLSKKQQLKLHDIASEKLLLLEEGHCFREQALEACAMSGAKDFDGFKATSLETLRHIVASGAGITLLPALSVTSASQDPAITIKSLSAPIPSRKVGMLWRKTTTKTQCCEEIARIIKSCIQKESYLKKHSRLKVMEREIVSN